jgi:hypothetical protein
MNQAAPAVTTDTLYNEGGILKWSGNILATGASVTGIAGRVALFTDTDAVGNSVMYEYSSRIGVGVSNPGSTLGIFGNTAIGSAYALLPAPADSLIVEGNIGVGLSSPSEKLDIVGFVNIPTGQAYKINNVALAPADIGAEPSFSEGSLTESGPATVLNIIGGAGSVIGSSGVQIEVRKATSSQDGYLASSDWSTFNAKLSSETQTLDTVADLGNITDQALVSTTALQTLGSVGIGITGSTLGNLQIVSSGTGTGTTLRIQDDSVDKFTILDKGNVGIGTTLPL